MSTFAKPDELIELSPAAIRGLYPDISFPTVIEPHHVADLGYLPIESDHQPEIQAGEELQKGALAYDADEQRIIRQWIVVPAPEPDWPAVIAARRYDAETAGITLNGMHIDTDDRSKLLINGAALEAVIDPSYVMQWKTPTGFVPLGAEQVIGVARAVRAHVQACFDREAVLLAVLDDETFTPEMLEEGWPG